MYLAREINSEPRAFASYENKSERAECFQKMKISNHTRMIRTAGDFV